MSQRESMNKKIAELESQVSKLVKINKALMARVEKSVASAGSNFNLLESNIALQSAVNQSTSELAEISRKLCREIDGRQRTEENLKDSERHLADIINFLPDATFVINKAGRVLTWNRRMQELTGVKEADIVGQGDYEYALPFYNKRQPLLIDLAHLELEEIRAYYPQSKKTDDITYLEDFLPILNEGCYIRATARPLYDSSGNIVGAIESVRDITSQKQTEMALLENEAKYRTLFDSAHDAIFLIHGEVFVDCNLQTLHLFKCGRSELIGQKPYYFSPEFQPDGRLSREKALEKISAAIKGYPQTFDWLHCTKDKTPFETEVSLNSMELGGETFLLAIVRDMTEKKLAEQKQAELRKKLERAERMESLGVLAGGVAHDLNNMLGPLVGYPELILMKLPEDSPMRKQVIKIGKAASDSAEVIQDLLTLARRGRYEMETVSFNDIINNYLDTPGFEKVAENRPEVKLNLKLEHQLPTISGSRYHLSKVIMNLVNNAYDAIKVAGEVTIETCSDSLTRLQNGYKRIKSGNYVILKIKDTGSGISKEDLPKIFEPYYSKKKLDCHSGSGLGLSVVYGVIKDHSGYYDINSEPGQGSEFILYFPALKSGPDNEIIISEDLQGQEKILVVDDEESQRDIAEALLTSLGYQVNIVKNGRQAIKFLKANSVDLVVLDMIMENDFDGLKTYEEIIRIHPNQKAVIVSGFSQTERVEKMQSLGAGQYIRKPYTRTVLGRAVRYELNALRTSQKSVLP